MAGSAGGGGNDSSTSSSTTHAGGAGGAETTSSGGFTLTSTSSGGSSSTSSSTTAPNSGDCDEDADCEAGSHCREITAGGYRVCVAPIVEVTECTGGMKEECCSTADCDAGSCLHWPEPAYCGGAMPMEQNRCMTDGCASDADCSSSGLYTGVCVEAGMFGHLVKTCVSVLCRTDRDCDDKPGGRCAPVSNPCCGQPTTLACNYPGEGCQTSADCPSGYCDVRVNSKDSECRAGFPMCPA